MSHACTRLLFLRQQTTLLLGTTARRDLEFVAGDAAFFLFVEGGVRSGQNDTTVSIPAFGTYTFATQGVQVEGWHGFPGVSESMQPDVQYPWEDRPTRLHEPRSLVEVLPKEETNGFEMDRHPVTNAQFLSFLQQSGWWPGNQTAAAAAPGASSLADGHSEQNFLNHWTTTASSSSSSKMGMAQLGTKRARTVGNPKKVPVAGTEQQPVRWVSMNDARRYCAFYGKRWVFLSFVYGT